jgi:hypothetical protein
MKLSDFFHDEQPPMFDPHGSATTGTNFSVYSARAKHGEGRRT